MNSRARFDSLIPYHAWVSARMTVNHLPSTCAAVGGWFNSTPGHHFRFCGVEEPGVLARPITWRPLVQIQLPLPRHLRGVVALNWSEQRPVEGRRLWVRVPSTPLDLPCAASRYLGFARRRALSAGSQGGTSSPASGGRSGPAGWHTCGYSRAGVAPHSETRADSPGWRNSPSPATGERTWNRVRSRPCASSRGTANRQTVHSLALRGQQVPWPRKAARPRPTRGPGRDAGSCGSRATGHRGRTTPGHLAPNQAGYRTPGKVRRSVMAVDQTTASALGAPGRGSFCLHGASVVRPER